MITSQPLNRLAFPWLAIRSPSFAIRSLYKFCTILQKLALAFKKQHYALAYNSGRYERYATQAEAKENARKIMAKTDNLGKVITY